MPRITPKELRNYSDFCVKSKPLPGNEFCAGIVTGLLYFVVLMNRAAILRFESHRITWCLTLPE